MASGDLKNWNLARCQFLVNGVPLEGFAEDDVFSAEFPPNYEGSTGADGEFTREKQNDRSATMMMTLRQTSAANAVLSFWDQQTRLGLPDTFSLRVINLDTGEEVSSAKVWVEQPPDLTMAKSVGDREWGLRGANVKRNYGTGNIAGLFPSL